MPMPEAALMPEQRDPGSASVTDDRAYDQLAHPVTPINDQHHSHANGAPR